MLPANPELLLDSWIGECSGAQIIGLFDRELQTKAPESLNQGDIVLVAKSITRLAPADHALNRILRLLAKYEMNPVHPNAVLLEASQFSIEQAVADPALVDLRELDFVTIDNEDSKDLDQAVYLTRTGKLQYRIYYALADAAWFVTPGTSLYEAAVRRGVTYYAPEIAVTMLPSLLSEDLISLNENAERRALVFQLDLDNNGALQSTQILRARIQSRAKLSYNSVQDYFDARDAKRDHAYDEQSWSHSLRLLETVGKLRMADSVERDVIKFNRREARVVIDPGDPRQLTISVRERNAVEQYNEQISLLCNTAGAQLLDKLERLTPELQAIYRVHLPPLDIRMQRFRSQLSALQKLRQLSIDWQWLPEQSLADFVEALPSGEEHRRLREAIERMIMMTNRASSYAADAEMHHALGVDAYARFSSPMREIVGIFTHKELLEALNMAPARDISEDAALRTQIIEVANEAKKRQSRLEKECQLLAIDSFLADDLTLPVAVRPRRSATVMGVRGNKVYLSLDGFALDLKLYLDDLEQQFGCEYESGDVAATASTSSAPSFVVGDEVSLYTVRWDESRRRYIFNI